MFPPGWLLIQSSMTRQCTRRSDERSDLSTRWGHARSPQNYRRELHINISAVLQRNFRKFIVKIHQSTRWGHSWSKSLSSTTGAKLFLYRRIIFCGSTPERQFERYVKHPKLNIITLWALLAYMSTVGDRAFPVAAGVRNALPRRLTSAPFLRVFWQSSGVPAK